VLSETTLQALTMPVSTEPLGSRLVKGRATPVVVYKIAARAAAAGPSRR